MPAGEPVGSSAYDIPSVTTGVIVCAVTAPSTHTALITVGATGVASSDDYPVNVTVYVAVTRSTSFHAAGNCPHSKPAANVAVTTTI